MMPGVVSLLPTTRQTDRTNLNDLAATARHENPDGAEDYYSE
jgi:hypothetical protein